MLYRKAKEQIESWLSDPKKALLVSGARQVGKTWIIRECLKNSGYDYIEINLIDDQDIRLLMEQSRTVDELIIGLSAAKNHSFKKKETIIFIDEVQELPDIVTQIKFWVDEGSYHYILSGSLLGIELRSLRSAPVGYLREIKMFPLDFEEFLIASGVVADTFDYLRSSFEKMMPISNIVHDKMMQHFSRYLIIGGMPEAVSEYIETMDISRVSRIQGDIIEQYKLDFTKYERIEKKLRLISIFEQIPSQLMKQNRRFNYSDIQKGLRFERLEDSFLWLTYAGVSIPVYNTTEPRVALKQNTKSTLLKLYASDVGLLTHQYGGTIRTKILTGDTSVNLGGIYENAVAQELNAHGFSMFFYNSHKNGELDFLIEQDMSVVPIEVKSGKDYTIHSAMSKTVTNKEYEIKRAYVLSNYNVRQEGVICYIPVYMAGFIKNEEESIILEPIDNVNDAHLLTMALG